MNGWVDEWMNEWMNGWMSGWMMDEWMNGWVDGWWMNGWMDEWMDEWMDDGWMNEWMYGWTERQNTDRQIVLLSLRSSTAITGDTAHSVDNILTTVINIPALTTGGDMTSCKWDQTMVTRPDRWLSVHCYMILHLPDSEYLVIDLETQSLEVFSVKTVN